MPNRYFSFLTLPLLCLGISLNAAADNDSIPVKHVTYQVPMNKSLLINLDEPVSKLSKGNPQIADVLLFPPNQLFLRGKTIGTTNTILWNKDKQVSMVLDVEVTHNLESLKQKLYELLPDEPIQVRSANRSIVLSGEVSNLVKMDAALKLAQGYMMNAGGAGGSGGGSSGGGSSGGGSGGRNQQGIINLMHVGGGQQVMLEVKIAEVSRELSRNLQINTAASRTQLEDGSFFWDAISAGAGIFTGSYVLGNTLFDWSLEFSRDTSLATILAEPNLTTQSGKKASFLSGGEFPYASDCNLGNCQVGFKRYGIGVEFLPVVLDSNRINLSTTVSVSELTNDANIVTNGSDNTPSLTTREAQTTIELADGQTMSIAGLLSKDSENNQSQTPGLADLPVIGSLFRNRAASRQDKELLILVTPHLARPIPRDQIRLPTDTFVEPDDIDFYLLGKMESRKAKTHQPTTGGTTGQFGHQLEEGTL